MRTAAQTIGADAEELVTRRLRAAGWTILGRNLHVGRAEIDILAIDASDRPELVAVEVRCRTRRDYGLPEETVSRAKLSRLRSAVLVLRHLEPASLAVGNLPVRVDLVAVEPEGRVRHYRGVS